MYNLITKINNNVEKAKAIASMINLSKIILLSVFLAMGNYYCNSAQKYTDIEKLKKVDKISEKISLPNMISTIVELQQLKTRYTYEKQREAAELIHNKIGSYIPDTRYQTYRYRGLTWKNVISRIPGESDSNQIVILCSHFDSKSDKRLIFAPGADDDASGCAALVEIARLLSQYHFKNTIMFAFFSREESGQDGSKSFLDEFNFEKNKFCAAINLDMISFGSKDEEIDLVTRPKHRWIVDYAYRIAQIYEIKTKKVIRSHCY